jgi:osmotically-inducible protein OsmY
VGKTTEIRDAVRAELRYDPLVDDTKITVQNLGGDVALNGTVPSYPQYLEAASAARRIYGVTKVRNHLEVVLPPEDRRDDATLAATADNALSANVAVPDTVKAIVSNGDITLTGTVHHGAERAAARQAVSHLTGVRNVKDDLEIPVEADPVDVTVLVRDALDRCALIPEDSDVAVATEGNTVTLSGHVRTWAEHDAAMNAAWMARGVYLVRDELSVTG